MSQAGRENRLWRILTRFCLRNFRWCLKHCVADDWNGYLIAVISALARLVESAVQISE